MNSTVQIYEFMGCIYAGIIMGAVYGVLDFIRILSGKKRILTVLLDALFLIICTVIACVCMYYLTYGRIALYHFFGFIIGILLYVKSIHFLILCIFSKH